MKKIAIGSLIIIAIVSFVGYMYINYNIINNRSKRKNLEYEEYYEDVITGTQMATLINKVINNNEANEVEKDEKGNYIDNKENSIKIQIKFIDSDETFDMERIKNGGIDAFLQNYSSVEFKCMKHEFHKKTGNISYMYFEEKESN